jgi:hypothetical protein
MQNKSHGKVFSIGGSILLALATEIIVIGHYWKMLSGVAAIAILGVLFVAYVQLWASYWYAAEEKDKPVKYTALAVSFGLAVVMALNAAVVLVLMNKERQATLKAQAEIAATKARGKEASRIRETTGSWRTANEFVKAEADIEKARIEAAGEEKAVAGIGADEDWERWAENYGKFWIYLVPFLFGILGKFALAIAIAMPGGAEFGKPTSKQSREAEDFWEAEDKEESKIDQFKGGERHLREWKQSPK